MPAFLSEDDNVMITNGGVHHDPQWSNRSSRTRWTRSTHVVEGLAGIKPGRTGKARVRGIVQCDKASATVIAAGDRCQIHLTTQLVTVQASVLQLRANVLCGRAVYAAGNGATTVQINLNGAGVI